MPRKSWKSVSLPETLLEEVDQAIKKKPNFWKSKADFVTYAVRRLLEQTMEHVKVEVVA